MSEKQHTSRPGQPHPEPGQSHTDLVKSGPGHGNPEPAASQQVTEHAQAHAAKVIGVSLAAAVGGFLFGFDSSVINGAVDSIESHFELGKFMLGFAVAIALIGCAIGAWFAGQLADRWGRKPVMLLGSVLFVVSSIGSGFAFSVPDLMLWRVLGGVGIGIASVIAPAYIAEIAPAAYRGALASMQQLAITIGIFAALLSDAVLADTAGTADDKLQLTFLDIEAWRWMFIVGVIPAVVYGLLALAIPESPRYLVGSHKDSQAADVLERVTGESDPVAKVAEIRESLASESSHTIRSLSGPVFGLHKLVWVAIGLAVLQQLVGINAIFYYSKTLWQSVGFTEEESFRTSVITAVINVAMTFVAILFVDRVGRRKLLLVGSIGMFIGLVMAAIAFTQQQGSGDDIVLPDSWGKLALVGANLFVVAFAATWGPVLWVMLGEMFPNHMRAYALGLATAANWIANFAITLSFPQLNQALGLSWIYGFFAFFAAVSFFFVRRFVVETNGRELEAMRA